MMRKVPKAQVNAFKPTIYRFKFKGTGAGFFKLWLVDLLLSIITLGIYSAWAKVRTQRYFYTNTILNQTAFEYLANPLQILKDRVIAVIILIPFGYLSSLSPILGLILLLLLLAATPYIVVRALCFQHRMSAYKSFRFDFQGTEKEAALVYLAWPLLSILTFGLLYPFAHQRMVDFYVHNTAYGDTAFENNALVSDFYKLYVFIFLLSFGLLGIAALLPAMLLGLNFAELDFSHMNEALLPVMISMYAMAFFVYFLVYAFIKSRVRNLIMNTTTLTDYVYFKSNLSLRRMLMLVFTNTFAIIFSLGLAYPWAKVRLATYRAQHTALQCSGPLDHFIDSHIKIPATAGDDTSEALEMDTGSEAD